MEKTGSQPRINTKSREGVRGRSCLFVYLRGYLSLAFLILLVTTSASAQSKAEREVSETVKQWAATIVSRDMDALGRILADDIIITDFNGGTRGKKEELEVLKPVAGVKTVSVDNEDVKIKIFDKTAVVTALTKMVFDLNGKEATSHMRYTAVFVKRDGRW